MNELLKIILSLSLSGALLILVLLLCRPLIKYKLSKKWQYYIWLIIIVRLLLPFSLETNLMGTIFHQKPPILPETDFSNPLTIPEQVVIGDGVQWEPDKFTTPGMFDIVKQNIVVICLLIWIITAVGLFIRKITVYQSFVKYIKVGRIEITDMALWEHVGILVEQIGLKRSVELYTNNLISSPLLMGFFRPCIMLPTTELLESDFENTILHELTHYKRYDMFYKWLVQFTICLHWFNPFVYLMGREVNRTCELSCDEAVIKAFNLQKRRTYGDTLLNAMKVGGNYEDKLASVSLYQSKELLKERLDAIMKYKSNSILIRVITLMTTFLVAIGAISLGAYAVQPTQSDLRKNVDSATTNNMELEANKSGGNLPDTPWAAMGSNNGQPYTYSQESYYQAPYIFEIGRNLNEQEDMDYPKTTITFSDKTTITVSFDVSCKEYASDENALAALKPLLKKLIEKYADSPLPMDKPLIVNVTYIGDNELVNLAEEYYTNEKLTAFSAIFPSLEIDIQKNYCSKMIDDGKTSFLSASAKYLNPDMLDYCAQKTYQNDKIALFSCIVPYLSNDQKQTWIVRASHDDKITFLSVLTEDK